MKILLAIDDSNFSVAAANSVVAHFPPKHTEVTVLHVVEPVIAMVDPPQMSKGYYPEVEDRLPQARELVDRVAKKLSSAGFKVTTAVTTGDARNTILESAAASHVDLIVLGSHGRTGLKRFFFGSVSEAVVRHAHCSVLIVRMPS
jgi:nucleotide-binding universal stress UspA family protein